MEKWDGRTERRGNPNDHDKLTRLLVLSESQGEDIREFKSDFKDHVKDDNQRFTKANWFIGIGVGIVTAVEILFRK